MGRRLLIVALILTVLAPPGVGLVGMQGIPSVAISGEGMPMLQPSGDDARRSMHIAGAAGHDNAMMEAHDHSAAECDEYCMNCSSHCTSTAIVSSGSIFLAPASQPHRFASGTTADRAFLLFRPPIPG